MKKDVKFVNNYFYHIYNRGVDGRKIFDEAEDYERFIHSLFEFNDKQFALPYSQIFKSDKKRPRELLVNMFCFCLMPNHFHVILSQRLEGGITKFMRKLGTGYTMFFNNKYRRTGVLFQGKFKAILIETDNYLLHLSRYIHLNPIELIQPGWRKEGVADWIKAENFLQKYRWSSLLDYLGAKNFPSVTKRDFIQKFFRDSSDYKKFLYSWAVKEQAIIKDMIIE